MDQLKKLFANLSLKQRISLGAAVLAVILGLVAFSRWMSERDYKPLYSGLSQEDAGAVLAKVRESGTEFRLADGGSAVLVPSAKVAELRLQLAAAGVPKSGRIGFELFDKTNFGVSDFTEQINYHRALEGELERTVMTLVEVEQARIHVTFPKDSVFLESRQPAKASVVIKLKPGARLSPQNITAICQMTASAVEGLAPEAVSVVDMRGNLLSRPRKPASPDSAEPDDSLLDYRAKLERDLIAKINTTLEPLLGSDKFRAGISVDCDFTSGEQSEETFDPGKSVMVTSQKTEDVSGSNGASGVPGTASNLPRPTSRPGSGGTNVARRTENIAYQSSRTVRRVRLPQGTVKRMSVSIVLDQNVRFEGTGPKAKRIIEAPSQEKVKAIHDLVAGVVGLNAERGDQLVIESLPFESTLNLKPPDAPVAPAPVNNNNNLIVKLPVWLQNALKNRMFVIGGAAAMGLLLILFVGGLWMLSRKRAAKKAVEIQKQLAAAAAAKNKDEETQHMEDKLAEHTAQRDRLEAEALNALKLAPVATKKSEVLTRHISEEAKKDPGTMAQIVRAWMNEKKDDVR